MTFKKNLMYKEDLFKKELAVNQNKRRRRGKKKARENRILRSLDHVAVDRLIRKELPLTAKERREPIAWT